MANTHDKLSHHATDVLPMESYGPYHKGPPAGEKRGYEANTGGEDSGSEMQTDMV